MAKITDQPINIIFETERLVVRRYMENDLHRFFSVNGDADIMRYIRPAQSLEQSKGFLQRIIADYESWPGMGRWAVFTKTHNHFLGSFAIIPIENSNKLQLGYALLKTGWGRGYATECVQGGLKYAFEKLGISEIAGITFEDNVPSQKVLLRNGFEFDRDFREEERQLKLYVKKRVMQ